MASSEHLMYLIGIFVWDPETTIISQSQLRYLRSSRSSSCWRKLAMIIPVPSLKEAIMRAFLTVWLLTAVTQSRFNAESPLIINKMITEGNLWCIFLRCEYFFVQCFRGVKIIILFQDTNFSINFFLFHFRGLCSYVEKDWVPGSVIRCSRIWSLHHKLEFWY